MALVRAERLKGDGMRRFLFLAPVALALSGCIESAVDLSASVAPAYPIVEGFYKAANDRQSPPFKVMRSGADYRAIDPTKSDGTGALFALMDPDHTGIFIAEDKTGAKDADGPRYTYYFVKVSAAGATIDLYDITPRNWESLPADLKKGLVAGAALRLAEDAKTETVLRALDRWLAASPSVARTTFRLVRK